MGTIPTQSAFTSGAVLTSTQMNQMRAVDNFWAAPPKVYAYASTATSLPNSTTTLIAFDTNVVLVANNYDGGGDATQHDITTNNSRFYARTTGKYRIICQAQFASNATGNRVMNIKKNAAGNFASGTLLFVVSQGAVNGTSTSVNLTTPAFALTAGDYVEMFCSQSSGGALQCGGDITTYLALELVAS